MNTILAIQLLMLLITKKNKNLILYDLNEENNMVSISIMTIIEVESNEHFVETVKTGQCMVDFFATWCGPCQNLFKNLHKIEEEFPDVTIVKVDVDNHDDIAETYKVKTIPHIIFYNDGKLQEKYLQTSDHNYIIEHMKDIFDE